MHRIKEYHRTTFHPTDGLTTELLPFTEEQLIGMDSVLEIDGLSIITAMQLINKWNKIAIDNPPRNGIQYSYSIPFIKKEYTDA
jgi:hypothetical protein